MLGRQAVSEPEVGVNEPPSGHCTLELDPQPADVDVDRAISLSKLSTPGEPAEVLARDDPVRVPGELRQQPQLSGGQQQRPAAHAGQVL